MSFDLTTEDQGENKQSWLECQKKGGKGKGKGWGSGLVGVVSGQGLGFGAGVFRFGVSGLKVQGKGFRENGSGFGDE